MKHHQPGGEFLDLPPISPGWTPPGPEARHGDTTGTEGSRRGPLVLAQGGKEERLGEERLGGGVPFAASGHLGNPTSTQAAVKASGFIGTFLGRRPSSPVRGDVVPEGGTQLPRADGESQALLSFPRCRHSEGECAGGWGD